MFPRKLILKTLTIFEITPSFDKIAIGGDDSGTGMKTNAANRIRTQ